MAVPGKWGYRCTGMSFLNFPKALRNTYIVNRIRKALEDGTYPTVPTTVADAIIAAGLILRTAK